MESHCIECDSGVDVRCFCDKSLKFCYRHFDFVDSKYKDDHSFTDIQIGKEYYDQVNKFLLIFKKSIILRSKTAIEVIEIATKAHLKTIQNQINLNKNYSKNIKIGIFEEVFKDSKDDYLKKWDLENFIQELKKSWGLKVNNQEIFCVDNELRSVLKSFEDSSNKFQEKNSNGVKTIL